jgi:hypothetical protein
MDCFAHFAGDRFNMLDWREDGHSTMVREYAVQSLRLIASHLRDKKDVLAVIKCCAKIHALRSQGPHNSLEVRSPYTTAYILRGAISGVV